MDHLDCIRGYLEQELKSGNYEQAARLRETIDYIKTLRESPAERTVKLAGRGDVGVWVWQDDGYDFPDSLTCPILIGADTMRRIIRDGYKSASVGTGRR